MPEGDVVLRAARRLHSALAGRELVGVDLRWPGVAGEGLRGRTTIEVISRGKHLLHRVEGGVTVHSHLRMDGSWRVVPLPRVTVAFAKADDIRAIVASAEQAGVGRKLGMLTVVPSREESRLVGHLGPDVLGNDWDAREVIRRLRRQPEREIGAALLDQRNLAGLGTIWVSEPLFAQRINPWTPVAAITDSALTQLLAAAQRMISTAANSDGREAHLVHSQVGRPCARCTRPLRKQAIGTAPQQRELTFCPSCQPHSTRS